MNIQNIYLKHYCNMCNIVSINFCNIDIKHLQHTYATFETLETDACNMRFQRNISLLLGRMEARRRVEFIGAELAGGVEITAPVESCASASSISTIASYAWARPTPGTAN
jgi:hypothetical protein